MRKVGFAGFTLVSLAAVGIGVALSSPVVYGQAPGIRRGEISPGSIFPSLRRGSEIGVSIRDVVRDDVSRMKLPAEAGAIVESVASGSPAATAGLRASDVIVEFDGEKVRSAGQLTRLVQETPAGRRVKATVMRDGRRTDIELVPAEAEGPRLPFDGDQIRDSIGRVFPQMGRGVLGVTTQELTPELATYFGAKDGVLVTSIIKDSPAEKGGIRVGDVITEVAGKSIGDARELGRELQDHQGEVALKIVRDKKELTLKVTPDTRTQGRQTFRGL